MTVGETGGVTVDEAVQYANAEGTELNMVFQFEQQELDGGESFKWNDRKIITTELKEVFSRWQNKLSGRAWNSLYWCNHDQPRIVSRIGDEGKVSAIETADTTPTGDIKNVACLSLREKSAKMLATCLHFLQGTPYVYQGEELGMTNAPFANLDDYRDLESINAYNALVLEEKRFTKEQMLRYMQLKSRDNSRTPMQWNSSANAGFSNGKPWIMVNPNYREINAEEQIARADSVFKFYQKLIQLRKTMDIITYGSFELLLPDDKDLFVYTRSYNGEKLLVVCNFAREERVFTLPERFMGGDILVTNENIEKGSSVVLGAFGGVVFRITL